MKTPLQELESHLADLAIDLNEAPRSNKYLEGKRDAYKEIAMLIHTKFLEKEKGRIVKAYHQAQIELIQPFLDETGLYLQEKGIGVNDIKIDTEDAYDYFKNTYTI